MPITRSCGLRKKGFRSVSYRPTDVGSIPVTRFNPSLR